MRTGLTKHEKTTDIWFDEKEPLIYIRTHNTDLKKRLAAYAGQHPAQCRQIDADRLSERFGPQAANLVVKALTSLAGAQTVKVGGADVPQEERQAGKQVLVVRMNKNKKFQKEKLAAEGYKDIVEFFNN